MIYHIVWFKLREGASSEDKATLSQELNALPALIPQIVELSCGEDFSGRSRGFDWGLLVKFQTREDGQIYDKHPAHQAFIARCKPLTTDVQSLDFEA